jgi:hypothetical protein
VNADTNNYVVCEVLWRAFSCANAFVRFGTIRRAGFVSFSAIIILTANAPADIGIAARYPGDKNIGSDPAVILAEDFESYTLPSQLAGKWSELKGVQYMRIATETSNFYSGSKGIEQTLPIGTNIGTSAHKDFAPGKEQLYIRAYFKYATDYYCRGSNHNGLGIQGNYPEGQAGTKPATDGTSFFLFLLQNNIPGAVSGLQTDADAQRSSRSMVLLRDDGESEHHWEKRWRGGVLVQRQAVGSLPEPIHPRAFDAADRPDWLWHSGQPNYKDSQEMGR